jgi:capsular exopolysaccharide synthesis family protein
LTLLIGETPTAADQAPTAERDRGRPTPPSDLAVATEAFHTLRSNLLLRAAAGARTFLFASAKPGEGKSTISANLACTLAPLKKRVLVIDADLRRPTVHRFFGVSNDFGLTDVLQGAKSAAAAWLPTPYGPYVLPAGPPLDDPQVALGSPAFAAVLAAAREEFDFIFIDSAPVLAVGDTLVLVRQVDAVLMVMKSGGVSEADARVAIERIRGAQGQVIGCVLTHVVQAVDAYNPYNSAYLGAR